MASKFTIYFALPTNKANSPKVKPTSQRSNYRTGSAFIGKRFLSLVRAGATRYNANIHRPLDDV